MIATRVSVAGSMIAEAPPGEVFAVHDVEEPVGSEGGRLGVRRSGLDGADHGHGRGVEHGNDPGPEGKEVFAEVRGDDVCASSLDHDRRRSRRNVDSTPDLGADLREREASHVVVREVRGQYGVVVHEGGPGRVPGVEEEKALDPSGVRVDERHARCVPERHDHVIAPDREAGRCDLTARSERYLTCFRRFSETEEGQRVPDRVGHETDLRVVHRAVDERGGRGRRSCRGVRAPGGEDGESQRRDQGKECAVRAESCHEYRSVVVN